MAGNLVGKNFARLAQDAHLLPVLLLGTDAAANLLFFAVVHHIGVVNRELTLDDLASLTLSTRLDVLRLDVDVLAQHLTRLGEHLNDVRNLALIGTGDDDNLVVRLNVHGDANRETTARQRLLFPLFLLRGRKNTHTPMKVSLFALDVRVVGLFRRFCFVAATCVK